MRSSRVRSNRSGNKGICAGRAARHAVMWDLSSSTQSNGQWKTEEPEDGGAVHSTTTGGQKKQGSVNDCGTCNNVRVKVRWRKAEQRYKAYFTSTLCLLPVVGWWGQVRRRRRVCCRQPQMKGRPSPATHHCGAALETDSRCCCPPQMHKSPPA